MRRIPIMAPLALLCLLAAPSHAAAQDAEEPPAALQGLLPAGLSEDQIVQFVRLAAADEDLAGEVAQTTAAMLAPGEQARQGWEYTGVNILDELAGMEGGLAGNLLLDEDPAARSVLDLSGRSSPQLAEFVSYVLQPEPDGVAERNYVSFSPGFWFASAHQRRQLGNALCYSGEIGVVLHASRPYTEWTEDELIEAVVTFSLIQQLRTKQLCVVYERDAQGRYTGRFHLPDGRTLPMIDAESTPARIMPAGELEHFIRTAVPDQTSP